MVEYKPPPLRLYLAKGEKDIFVDTVCLPQHQYDGIRFLYRQFRKGKAGAILNDPSGYGKRIQTALFINAMHPVMPLPILVLCTEGKEQIWTRLFNKWTNLGTKVTVQKSNEIVKPVCVISVFSHMSALARREWSIVVVDDNNVSRDVLRSGLNAKYKIWITSVDMKKNLQTFSLIYKWFYAKDRFVVEDFQATLKTPTALLTKSAKLDAFMEDIVIRRKDFTVPLGKSSHTVHPPKVTRKNKDATGRKIKRSRPKPEDEQDTISESQEIVTEQLPKNGDIESISIEEFTLHIKKTQTEMDVDTVEKEITSINASHCNNELDKNSVIKSNSSTKEENHEETEEIVVEPSNIDGNHNSKGDSAMRCDKLNYSNSTLNSDDILSHNITFKYDSDTPDIDDNVENDIIPKKITKSTEINYNNNQIESEDLFSADLVSSDVKSESEVKNHEVNVNSNANTKSNVTNCENNKIHIEDEKVSAGLSTNKIKDEIEIKTNDIINKNELVNKNNETDSKLDGIELKMKQMEELVMKKFKGSFLDNMF